ncbi:MAG: hypothetical protein CMH04_00775 [Marinovum sp.]|nr:hypothetical protein [Marinovum sp.]|tara:strand:+ start:876 stop:1397 length:522 start_codon:yes stop_codon:yes gene_type:complete
MASELQVTTIRGVPTGASANQIVVPSGQTLSAPGHVIQVVYGFQETQVANTTNNFVDTGLSAIITPKLTTSKVLVLIGQSIWANISSLHNEPDIRLMRNTTAVKDFLNVIYFGGGGYNAGATVALQYLDSPAVGSAITYKTQFRNTYASDSSNKVDAQHGTATSTITLLEIAQ